ncbi:MAG: 2-amino-4-hydroxy-6-hydroxymethyldihydropteridine diphosphokinase [Acidobacteria bacterium]|nr:2-amino-4-hydroxy-6-hydroxymethyldihydropteridine diphosphokinase [Acidobacteriota bacterium]
MEPLGTPTHTEQESLRLNRSEAVYLSLGSNVGNPEANLRAGLGKLGAAGIGVRRVSSFYRTAPLEYLNQPWFVNCVAEVDVPFEPLILLETLQRIERAFAIRSPIPKGPRRLDIDILLFGHRALRSPRLTVPHPKMGERRFVLVPLVELAGEVDVVHPVTNLTVERMLARTPDTSAVEWLCRGG